MKEDRTIGARRELRKTIRKRGQAWGLTPKQIQDAPLAKDSPFLTFVDMLARKEGDRQALELCAQLVLLAAGHHAPRQDLLAGRGVA